MRYNKQAMDRNDTLLHHANLLVGAEIGSCELLLPYRTPNHDVHHVIRDSLTIDDVRSLGVQSIERPLVNEEVVFVIVARTINHEAQHALLKLLEEPPSFVRFFLVVPKAESLLPTVRSRLSHIDTAGPIEPDTANFTHFLSQTYSERFEEVAKRTKAKDTAWADAVVAGAESYAKSNLLKNLSFAKTVSLVAQYRGLRGSSQKMLLEELALTLPKN